MAEDPKNTTKEFPGCCEGMPFAEMMRKMMEAKKSGSFSCTEMMSQMTQMCHGAGKKKEECGQKKEETPGSKA